MLPPYQIVVPVFGRGRIVFLVTGIVILAAFLIMLPTMMVHLAQVEPSQLAGFLLFSVGISRYLFYPFAAVSMLLGVLLIVNLWAFFARETLEISEHEILFSKSLFGIGHTHHLSPEYIQKVVYIPSTMSINPTKRDQTFKARGFHEGKISIICNGRTFRFGRALEDQQAAVLADNIDLLIRSRKINEAQIPLSPAK